MWSETGGWSIGWIGIGLIHMALFWGFVIFVIVALVRLLPNSPETSPATRKSPIDILRERYARGEIDRQEFEEARKRLIE